MTARLLAGWLAVGACTAAACFWAFWGAIEAFHEGWTAPTLLGRLVRLLPYVAPSAIFAGLAVLAALRPRIGAGAFVAVGLFVLAATLLDRASIGPGIVFGLTALPIAIGLLFLVGRPEPRWLVLTVAVALPVSCLLGFGAGPAWRVATRVDDGGRDAYEVRTSAGVIRWAPAGPGWSSGGGVSWDAARERARHLSADGRSMADTPQHLWRLPTRAEAVESMVRHGASAGGGWDGARATYARRPDKETPLWDPTGSLIYLWTADEIDPDAAWIVVYHGGVHRKRKQMAHPNIGFRAVRSVEEAP